MATTTATVARDYGASNIAILSATLAGIAAADLNQAVLLPAGFGDCQIIRVTYQPFGFTAKTAATGVTEGCVARIHDAAGAVADWIGERLWVGHGLTQCAVTIEPETVVLCRQTDTIFFMHAQIDTGVGTHSYQALIEVVRLRNLGA